MTTAHLVLATTTTGYPLMATREEQEFIRTHGEAYPHYREQVPKILPLGSTKKRKRASARGPAHYGMVCLRAVSETEFHKANLQARTRRWRVDVAQ
jgi:hypothetical protein